MSQRVLGRLVTECRDLPFGCLRAHAAGQLQAGADGLQQGLVEQLCVQPRHPHVLPFELLTQHPERVVATIGADVGGTGQPAHRFVVVEPGQHVGALEPLKLKSVLEKAEELIRRGQVRRVVTADVAAGPEGGQRVKRRGHLQSFVITTVHKLQQLHRELDVSQSARPELELPVPNISGYQFLDAPPHGLHLRDEVLPLSRGPYHRHQRFDVLAAEL